MPWCLKGSTSQNKKGPTFAVAPPYDDFKTSPPTSLLFQVPLIWQLIQGTMHCFLHDWANLK